MFAAIVVVVVVVVVAFLATCMYVRDGRKLFRTSTAGEHPRGNSSNRSGVHEEEDLM